MPSYQANVAFFDLPRRIVRRCCLRKTSCGPVTLLRHGVADFDQDTGEVTIGYTYVRESNLEPYWPLQRTVADLAVLLDVPEYLYSKVEREEMERLGHW